jgi:hypothetical protein
MKKVIVAGTQKMRPGVIRNPEICSASKFWISKRKGKNP